MMRTDEFAKVGDRPVGDSRFPYAEVEMSWFDHWLKGNPTSWKPMPKVQIFLMGANVWLTGDGWPLKDSRRSRLLLDGGGHANTLEGDGQLVKKIEGGEIVDHFDYNPNDPTPTVGGGLLGAVSTDQRPVEERQDVLVYSTPKLTRGVAFVGDIHAVLYISTEVKDTDVAVKLVDVYPDGTAYNVQDSILRLQYRNGKALAEEVIPGQIYRVDIGEMVTGNYFAPGHRVRLEIAGANFPSSDRNWNNGGRNDLATTGPVAHISVHHGPKSPSHVEFTEYTGDVMGPR
jgi:putative CocE/NonD family hydrolase